MAGHKKLSKPNRSLTGRVGVIRHTKTGVGKSHRVGVMKSGKGPGKSAGGRTGMRTGLRAHNHTGRHSGIRRNMTKDALSAAATKAAATRKRNHPA